MLQNINKIIVPLAIVLGVLVFVKLIISVNIAIAFFFALLPLGILYLVYLFKMPYLGLLSIFLINYFIMGMTRYVASLQGGIVMDGIIGLTFFILLIHLFNKNIEIKRALNGVTIVSLVWLFYCVLELFNPLATSKAAWATTIRGVAIYFFLIAILTSLLIKNIKDVILLLRLWAVFSILAFFKAFIQKYFGFDNAELYWLYFGGGADTHLIHSGTRYFSFFTDAGNFGSGMGYSMVVFTIVSIYIKGFSNKIFFFIVAILSAYSMMFSGTRGALAVPFGGFLLYVFLSKNVKAMVASTVFLIGAFVFLNYTQLGHGNAQIRRMRSAFNKNDPSLQVRLENQKKLRTYMSGKPFGVGIGLGGVKAKRYAPYAFTSNVPTDSWFVMIWVETGIIGLFLHIAILLYILAYGAYLALFVLKDIELRGIVIALLCGISGIYATSYGNEVLGQFPTGIILYMSMAIVFVSPYFDKEIEEEKMKKIEEKISENDYGKNSKY